MDATGGFVAMILFLLFAIAIFLACRAIVLWYWKVDKIVSLLESINTKLGSEPAIGSMKNVVEK